MKTTIELPDDLFREAKAAAAREGRSLKDLFTVALREHVDRVSDRPVEGWRAVFGQANASEVAAVDSVVDAELETVDLDTWR